MWSYCKCNIESGSYISLWHCDMVCTEVQMNVILCVYGIYQDLNALPMMISDDGKSNEG